MSRKWWTIIIVIAVIVGFFAAVKLLPLWVTLLSAGTYAFGCFSGYILKKKEIVEKIIEKPVEVIKKVVERVEVPVEKIVEKIIYKEALPTPTVDAPIKEEPKVVTSSKKKKHKSNKVAE